VQLLTVLIIATGTWPEVWLQHWVAPLFKKKNVFDPDNYRGIHLTAQLSKVVERLLKALLMPFITSTIAFGPNQFAYTNGRGARDALATLVLTWIEALARGRKIAIYCSDVSGAFDRVDVGRLVAKLRIKKVHPQIISVLESWLRQRMAYVVVGGMMSVAMLLKDMVFQGTVPGPTLWNVLFKDARAALNEWFFEEVVYADDLNAYRVFMPEVSNIAIKNVTKSCQNELHNWGKANQVVFDATKESSHILSLSEPAGDSFKLLGVTFDVELTMADAVAEVVTAASWKLRTLVRTRRYYTDGELVVLYKAHLLSFLEYRTAAIYHAARAVLKRLDAIQTRFLHDAGIDEVAALMVFNLAPLSTRRDIAMLGVLHRAALGEGPPQLRQIFRRRPGSLLLEDVNDSARHPLIKRSIWGLVAVYNRLCGARHIATVADFQKYLQERLKRLIDKGLQLDCWQRAYSPR
jgi:hypothetical protein